MTALTPWYPPEVKPVHVGWYQREYAFPWLTEAPDYWDGSEWFSGFNGIACINPSLNQTRHWRGLVADPSVTK